MWKLLRIFYFHIFNVDADNASRVVPSFGMMQLILNIKHGANAPKIRPAAGKTLAIDLAEDWRRGERVIGCPSPLIHPVADSADGVSAPWYDFALHDFFHHFASGWIPHAHRLVFGEVWKSLSSSCMHRFRVLDMDFDHYEPHRKHLNASICFWESIRELAGQWEHSPSSSKAAPKHPHFYTQQAFHTIFNSPLARAVGLDRSSFHAYSKHVQGQETTIVNGLSLQDFLKCGGEIVTPLPSRGPLPLTSSP